MTPQEKIINQHVIDGHFVQVGPYGNRIHVKAYKLSNLRELEALYWRGIQYANRWYARWFQPVYEEICALGNYVEVHAKVEHDHTNDPARVWYWKYKFEKWPQGLPFNTRNFTHTYTFDWEADVKDPKNLELGQRFYKLDRFLCTINNRRFICSLPFEDTLRKWTSSVGCVAPPKMGQLLHLIINNRDYWFQPNSHYTAWEILCRPDEDTIHIEV